MNFQVGDRVTILEGKHKGRTAIVFNITDGICCLINHPDYGELYFWFRPSSLQLVNPVNNEEESETMDISTSEIDNQINELRLRLSQLEKQKEVLATSESLLGSIAKCADQMREYGIGDDDIESWAETIYEVITGEPVLTPADVVDVERLIKERDEAIARAELLESRYESDRVVDIDALIKQRDDALQAYSNLTAAHLESIQKLKEEKFVLKQQYSDLSIAYEELKKEHEAMVKEIGPAIISVDQSEIQPQNEFSFIVGDIVQYSNGKVGTVTYIPPVPSPEIISIKMLDGVQNLHVSNLTLISRPAQVNNETTTQTESTTEESVATFEVGDRVQVVQSDDESLLHRHGQVAQVSEDEVCVLFRATIEYEECEAILGASQLKLLPGNSEMKTQEIVAAFLKKLDRYSRVEKLKWDDLKKLPLNIETLKEIGLTSQADRHRRLVEKMPELCADYIREKSDRSDLEWLPDSFVQKVEELLSETKSEPESEPDQLELTPF